MHMPLGRKDFSFSLSSSIVHCVPSRNLIDSTFPTSSSLNVIVEFIVVSLSEDNDDIIGVQNTIHGTEVNHGTVFHFVPFDFAFNSSQFK